LIQPYHSKFVEFSRIELTPKGVDSYSDSGFVRLFLTRANLGSTVAACHKPILPVMELVRASLLEGLLCPPPEQYTRMLSGFDGATERDGTSSSKRHMPFSRKYCGQCFSSSLCQHSENSSLSPGALPATGNIVTAFIKKA
jgi:hypothetical protein